MTQARKALYATVGATEAALAGVKSLPKQASEIRGRLNGRAGSLRDLPKTAIDAAKDAPTTIAGFFSNATDRFRSLTKGPTKRATKTYNDLAKRGEKLVKKISKSAPTRRAAAQTKSAKSRTKAAATSIAKAVEADVAAAAKAAETVAEVG